MNTDSVLLAYSRIFAFDDLYHLRKVELIRRPVSQHTVINFSP